VFRRINPNSEPRCSIESGAYTLQCVVIRSVCTTTDGGHRCSYLIMNNVVYLTIADKSYPRKLAFSYLDELAKEFDQSHGAQVDSVRKPYAFVGFGACLLVLREERTAHEWVTDTFMSKTARLYQDTRTAGAGAGGGALDTLNNELQDVTRIMTKNMEELLWRGDTLDSMSAQPFLWDVLSRCVVPRNVQHVDFAAFRIREIPQGRAEHQHPGDDPQVRAARRGRPRLHHHHLVEILVERPVLPICSCMYVRMHRPGIPKGAASALLPASCGHEAPADPSKAAKPAPVRSIACLIPPHE
jgi:hypothetical protein